MSPIVGTDDLRQFCARASAFPFVTVDTEFVREKTYWPKLCLVQIGTPEEEQAIDMLADLDIAPLLELLQDKSVVKVFHSARQDLEIFFYLSGQVPGPVFDTQVAATVCGYGDSVGYERLVENITGKTVDKSMQVTDWEKRPLNARQIRYALGDVTHLREIYSRLSRSLSSQGRESWLSEEMAVLTDPETYRQDPETAWKRLKLKKKTPERLAILQALACWRENAARREDLPRNWVLRDETLSEIAFRRPKTASEAAALKPISRDRSWRKRAPEVMRIVDQVRAMDPKSYPVPPPEQPRPDDSAAVELLKALLRARCTDHGVAPRLVASSTDLYKIVCGENEDVPALQGWRRELFGNEALRLMRGELALSLCGSALRITEISTPSPTLQSVKGLRRAPSPVGQHSSSMAGFSECIEPPVIVGPRCSKTRGQHQRQDPPSQDGPSGHHDTMGLYLSPPGRMNVDENS